MKKPSRWKRVFDTKFFHWKGGLQVNKWKMGKRMFFLMNIPNIFFEMSHD